MVDSLCQMGLGQPTKTNTNNNTWPEIQLQSDKIHPIFSLVLNALWRKWLARWAGINVETWWVWVLVEGLHFSWKRFQILQNTIDFVRKVGLWLRLINMHLMRCRHLTKFLDFKTKANLYYSFFYPHLIYDIELLGSCSWLFNIESFNKPKAIRIILKQPLISPVFHKFNQLKIMTAFYFLHLD